VQEICWIVDRMLLIRSTWRLNKVFVHGVNNKNNNNNAFITHWLQTVDMIFYLRVSFNLCIV
jgi:hypothetical protein